MDAKPGRMMGVIGAFLLSISLVSCDRAGYSGRSPADPREISFKNASGVPLSGVLYSGLGTKRSGVVLVHDAGSSREAWGGFPERIRSQGYTCLAIDLAGHGASGDETPGDFRTFSDEDWAARVEDLTAAKAVLVAEGCDPNAIAMIGAGMGGILSLGAAARGEAASIVLISPELELHGMALLPILERVEQVPMLVLAGEGDSAAVHAGERLQSAAPVFCELRVYAGSMHGAGLIASSETATVQVLQWLEQTLPTPEVDAG